MIDRKKLIHVCDAVVDALTEHLDTRGEFLEVLDYLAARLRAGNDEIEKMRAAVRARRGE